MKKGCDWKGLICLLIALSFTQASSNSIASNTEANLPRLSIDLQNKARLQRGARIFMNYCSGCHSLKYMRYDRMAKDLEIISFDGEVDKDLLVNNLIFTKAKIFDPIQIAMPEADAREWFGKAPPDLTLTARQRGASWIYAYLTGFYADPKRPFGTNNTMIPDVAMPNVLAPLQGQVLGRKDAEGALHLVLLHSGEMSQGEFDSTVKDLVHFLAYAADPSQLIRYKLGVKVIFFLLILLLLAYLLKKSYWKQLRKT